MDRTRFKRKFSDDTYKKMMTLLSTQLDSIDIDYDINNVNRNNVIKKGDIKDQLINLVIKCREYSDILIQYLLYKNFCEHTQIVDNTVKDLGLTLRDIEQEISRELKDFYNKIIVSPKFEEIVTVFDKVINKFYSPVNDDVVNSVKELKQRIVVGMIRNMASILQDKTNSTKRLFPLVEDVTKLSLFIQDFNHREDLNYAEYSNFLFIVDYINKCLSTYSTHKTSEEFCSKINNIISYDKEQSTALLQHIYSSLIQNCSDNNNVQLLGVLLDKYINNEVDELSDNIELCNLLKFIDENIIQSDSIKYNQDFSNIINICIDHIRRYSVLSVFLSCADDNINNKKYLSEMLFTGFGADSVKEVLNSIFNNKYSMLFNTHNLEKLRGNISNPDILSYLLSPEETLSTTNDNYNNLTKLSSTELIDMQNNLSNPQQHQSPHQQQHQQQLNPLYLNPQQQHDIESIKRELSVLKQSSVLPYHDQHLSCRDRELINLQTRLSILESMNKSHTHCCNCNNNQHLPPQSQQSQDSQYKSIEQQQLQKMGQGDVKSQLLHENNNDTVKYSNLYNSNNHNPYPNNSYNNNVNNDEAKLNQVYPIENNSMNNNIIKSIPFSPSLKSMEINAVDVKLFDDRKLTDGNYPYMKVERNILREETCIGDYNKYFKNFVDNILDKYITSYMNGEGMFIQKIMEKDSACKSISLNSGDNISYKVTMPEDLREFLYDNVYSNNNNLIINSALINRIKTVNDNIVVQAVKLNSNKCTKRLRGTNIVQYSILKIPGTSLAIKFDYSDNNTTRIFATGDYKKRQRNTWTDISNTFKCNASGEFQCDSTDTSFTYEHKQILNKLIFLRPIQIDCEVSCVNDKRHDINNNDMNKNNMLPPPPNKEFIPQPAAKQYTYPNKRKNYSNKHRSHNIALPTYATYSKYVNNKNLSTYYSSGRNIQI